MLTSMLDPVVKTTPTSNANKNNTNVDANKDIKNPSANNNNSSNKKRKRKGRGSNSNSPHKKRNTPGSGRRGGKHGPGHANARPAAPGWPARNPEHAIAKKTGKFPRNSPANGKKGKFPQNRPSPSRVHQRHNRPVIPGAGGKPSITGPIRPADFARFTNGAIFLCTKSTLSECLDRGLFGLPDNMWGPIVSKIKPDTAVFLQILGRQRSGSMGPGDMLGLFVGINPPKKNICKDA